ncbi:FAD-dependent oxidoreductase [Collinsella tanakaei]|uniref:FAD-dependent oxidoreductase n=1 Tax=Collinsella tanakaei TaxID=626935 RepID=UPI00195D4EC6|nr:FAD-dependent oxidoreductase [Collinsella tanakaei]MBM6867302.1 FAD-dependent oxidoreductase [Collinsella tanakaei]
MPHDHDRIRTGTTDVLVIGSGIAGCCAAVEAARAGARVTIACAGALFSGSSFFPGTWGLGLIGPVDDGDAGDLVDTICRVGCGAADRDLAETLVDGIRPSMAWLEGLGVELKRPQSERSAREAAFIPCFDHKRRLWRGLTRDSMQRAFARAFEGLGVRILARCELMDLIESDGDAGARIVGAVLLDRDGMRFLELGARAVVLAAGGTGGLFERSLTSRDALSSSHGIALAHGCGLVNIEFMQMMPGLIAPRRGIVFNEKSFRFARMDPQPDADLLEMRATYGPFTCRLPSCAIDLAIDRAGAEGLAVRYRFPKDDVPEFVRTFCDWLEREQGIAPDEELRIAMYAHAANGGIRIDADGFTGVAGLYAAGEVCGGMHGADRIGGLSSANGLVYGRRAGRAAAAWATSAPAPARGASRGVPAEGLDDEAARALTARMRRTMSAHAMIFRTDTGLAQALADIDAIGGELERRGVPASGDAASVGRAIRLRSQLTLARAMLTAMRERTASAGSHYRADEPRR